MCLEFYDHDDLSADDHMFNVWFNTNYIKNNYLKLTLDDIDYNCKTSNRFLQNFTVELFFENIQDDNNKIFKTLINS